MRVIGAFVPAPLLFVEGRQHGQQRRQRTAGTNVGGDHSNDTRAVQIEPESFRSPEQVSAEAYAGTTFTSRAGECRQQGLGPVVLRERRFTNGFRVDAGERHAHDRSDRAKGSHHGELGSEQGDDAVGGTQISVLHTERDLVGNGVAGTSTGADDDPDRLRTVGCREHAPHVLVADQGSPDVTQKEFGDGDL
ncbi:hypothetical protein [Streptomyces sp. NPDC002490]|uniref:hypothetical protein n=1 Tax=Streptomyces sp. NPDC002490 TaxID=3154416 RepID=UPI003327D821